MQPEKGIMTKLRTTQNKDEETTLPAVLVELANEVLRSVLADMARQARYGQLQNAPISISVQQVSYLGASHHVVVLATVYPAASMDDVLAGIVSGIKRVAAEIKP